MRTVAVLAALLGSVSGAASPWARLAGRKAAGEGSAARIVQRHDLEFVDPASLPAGSKEFTVQLGDGSKMLCQQEAAGVRTCRGIPYAQPPVGGRRWTNPVPNQPWSGILNATVNAPGCMQACDTPPHTCPPVISEDCLYINVFSPPGAGPRDRLPVMVWFYGGNFKEGSNSGALYDGTGFVQNTTGGMVVVTTNYRVGAFGFAANSHAGLTGNYGFYDQIATLNWVQQHAAAFGGDPSRVTIFGQSAGAESVGTHLVSPKSRGLFHRAIMQSNPYSLRFRTTGADADRASTALAKFLGCSTLPVSRDCLNAANSSALLAAQVEVGKDILATLPLLIQLFEVWTPVIDGDVLTEEPWQLLRNGGAHPDVDIMMGTTQNEGVLFVYGAFGKPIAEWEYDIVLGAIFGLGAVGPLKRAYPVANSSDARAVASEVATHGIFTCLNRNVSVDLSAASPSQRVYMYRFAHPPSFGHAIWRPEQSYCYNKVCHGDDLPFTWNPIDSFKRYNVSFEPEEAVLGAIMLEYWVSFAATGVPRSPKSPVPEWPRMVDTGADAARNPDGTPVTRTMYFDVDKVGVRDNFFVENEHCALWDTLGYMFA